MKIRHISFILVLFLLISISVFADKGVAIKIVPHGTSAAVVYAGEETLFDVYCFNLSDNNIYDMVVKLKGDYGINFKAQGVVLPNTAIKFNFIPANKDVSKTIIVVPSKTLSAGTYNIYAEYETEGITEFAGAKLSVTPTPIKVTVNFEKFLLNPGESDKIYVRLKNTSAKELTGIQVEFTYPMKLRFDRNTFAITQLNPLDSAASTFVFDTSHLAHGRYPITINITYFDDKGKHIFSESYFIDVSNRWNTVVILLSILGAVIIINILWGTYGKKPRVMPVQE